MHLDSELRRDLGPFSATCVVIGVGIFFAPKNVALLTGNGELTLITWTFGGMLALLGALSLGKLGGLYPRTAGQYEILRDPYGAVWFGCAVNAVGSVRPSFCCQHR